MELTWNKDMIYLGFLFYKTDVTEIDFSNFDTSKVTIMAGMFQYCKLLTSLNLSNFNTANVENMNFMFDNCILLTSLDLSNFNTSKVKKMYDMFNGCLSLSSLNLSNFDTSHVTDMCFIFSGCYNLTVLDISSFNTSNTEIFFGTFSYCYSLSSLDLSNFDTSKVTYMGQMFWKCSSLTSLNLSNFNTLNVVSMHDMFSDCLSLTSLDLSSFNTSNVKNMQKMFSGSSKLAYLDLSSFNTSKTNKMEYMFNGCVSLTSLNLSNFDTSSVTNMDFMFYDCVNLKYINLKNFNENSLNKFNNTFYNVPDNVVVCINENNIKILSDLFKKNCYTIDCSDEWETKVKKNISKTGICIDNFNNDIHFKYEYEGKFYENCINGNLVNNSTIKECICDSEKCRSCPYEALSGNLCAECNTDYYRIENDPLNFGIYFNCYKEPVGYYLDKEDFVYKKCFHTCETCEVKGDYLNNNCIKCNSDYSYQIEKNNYTNCYENCTYYHYFDNESYYHCTINNTCPEEYPKLIEENLECMKDDDINIFNSTEIIIGVGSSSFLITSDIYNESYQSSNMIEKQMTSDLENFKSLGSSNEILYDNDISTSLTELKANVQNEDIKKIIQDMLEKVTTEKNEEEQRKYYDKLIELIKKYFTSENYDFSILNNNEDEMIESEKMNIIFTTLNNQKNNKNINNITLDLEECENLLKDFYNITNNETLYIQLLVISQAGMKIPKLLYYVYGSISGTNLERLNLSVCKNSKISLYIPVNITESLDILNSSSDYYKDICYPTTSEDGTDINLKDRKNEFIEKNKTVCQEDCAFS